MAQTAHGTERVSASKAAKRLKHIKVDPADNGGFIVSHHYHPGYGGTPKPDKHVFADYAGMHSHLSSHMGVK